MLLNKLLLLTILIIIPTFVSAQKKYTASIDKYMTAQHEINDFNGNVLVTKSGKIIYQKSFGYRNFDTKELLDNNSVFELASVSKQFTAMGILLLIDKGKLSFSDTLRKFFPELPYSNITIQNLLTHTSGLPDYMESMADKWDHSKIAFNDDVIKFLSDEKIPEHFEPGEKWEYSNTAYQLLASIIEKVSGQSFQEYMDVNVFKPLEMNSSRVYNTRRSTREIIPNYAFGFTYSDSLKKYILPDSLKEMDMVIYLDGIQGDGIINSTTGDLLKWELALKNSSLLSESLQKEMLSPQSVIDSNKKEYYGYGVILRQNQFGDVITHSGGWLGYSSILTNYPDEDFTIIVLSNNESSVSTINDGITGILFKKDVEIPYAHNEIEIDQDILEKYTGTFSGNNLIISVILKDGKLFRHTGNSPDIELKSESDKKFFYGNGLDKQIEFETDESGNIIKIWYISGGLKSELIKTSK